MTIDSFDTLQEFDNAVVIFHAVTDRLQTVTRVEKAHIKILYDGIQPATVSIALPLEAYPRFMLPDTGKTPTDKQLISAINAGPWLAVMMYRDWLHEQGKPEYEPLIFGLTWLIDYHKFPRGNYNLYSWSDEGAYDHPANQTSGRTSYHHAYFMHTLPKEVMSELNNKKRWPIGTPPGQTITTPKQYPSIHEAYCAAALAVWEHRDELYPEQSGTGA